MEIQILGREEQSQIYPQVYALLAAADREFVPPLSSRSSATQQNFLERAEGNGITRYFEQLKGQRFAAAFEGGELLGFVSYRENYTCGEIPPEELPNIYISTLVVSPKARGRGVTNGLYGRLFSKYEAANIFTRTWSTNIAHIKILKKFAFEEIRVLENDRGNGIATVYFKKTHK